MRKNYTKYLVLILVFLVGLFWIYLDGVVTVVAFSLVVTLPLLGLMLLTCFVFVVRGKVTKNRDLVKKGIQGLALLFVFILSPALSVKLVDKVSKLKAQVVIEELETYKELNGYYPDNLSVISIKDYPEQNYSYDGKTGSYTIKFRNGGLITTKFDSENRRWINYGWND